MKKTALTFILSLVWSIGFGQNQQQIDSLKHEFLKAKQDTNKVKIFWRLSEVFSDTDSSLFYAGKGLDLSKKINFARGEATGLLKMAVIYRKRGDLISQSEYLQKAMEIFKKTGDERGMMRALALYADHYFWQNDFRNELDVCHLPAVKIARKLRDTFWVAGILGNIGKTYVALGQLDSAEISLTEGYQLMKQRLASMDKNDPVYLFAKSDAAYIFCQLGSLKRHKDENEEALMYLRQAIALCIESNDEQQAAWVYKEFSNTFWETNQMDSALYYANQSLNIAVDVDTLELTVEVGEQLSQIYEKIGDYKEALRFKKMALSAREKLYNDDKMKKLSNLTFREKQRELELAAAKTAYQNQLRLYALLTGLGILLLVAFLLYRNNRQKQKANNLLHRQKTEIDIQRDKAEKALFELKSTQTQLIQSEKLASLGELTAGIAHEIQNPLNFVNNFSELSVDLAKEINEEIDKEPLDKAFVKELMGDLSQNQKKINLHGKRAAAIVSGMLQHARSSTGTKEPTDLNALADEYLRLSYHGLRAKDPTFNATMVTDFDPAIGKVNVIPQDMGRVLLNLINNAFYAGTQRERQLSESFKLSENSANSYEPTVTVSSRLLKTGMVEIRIKDNGTGIPDSVKAKIFQPFFTTKPTGQGTGLGLSLAYDIVVKGHGGTLEVESVEGERTEFVIRLPNP